MHQHQNITPTHDLKKFDEENLSLKFHGQDWDNILVLVKENINETTDNFLQNLKERSAFAM